MKPTLLEIVQRVGEFCNVGSLNSINDTRESKQIANIVKETFEDLVLRRQITTSQSLLQLQSLSDVNKPTYLKLPDDVMTLDIVKYKTAKGSLVSPQYLEPMQFVEASLGLDPTQENVLNVSDFSGILFNVKTDKDPSVYTVMESPEGEYVVFDSLDKDFEDTVQTTNSVIYGHIMPEFKLEDSFVPALRTQQFPVLLSAAKNVALAELLDQQNLLEIDKGRKQAILVTQQSSSPYRGSELWNTRMKNSRR